MIVSKREVRQASKKLLSVLLAVIMIMTSMSVCFGTVSFAAASDTQWNTLVSALKYDSVKNMSYSGSAGSYTLTDTDGKVLSAIAAYYAVFNATAKTDVASGQYATNGKSNSMPSIPGNVTVVQVNDTIKAELKSRMGDDYSTYNVENVLKAFISNATIATPVGSETTTQSSNATSVGNITVTVNMQNPVTRYTVGELGGNVVSKRVYTIKHRNDAYVHRYTETTSGCSTTTTNYYKYFVALNGQVTSADTEINTKPVSDANTTLSKYTDLYNKSVAEIASTAYTSEYLGTASSEITSAYNSVANATGLGAGVFSHYFGSYNVATSTKSIDDAIAFRGSAAIVEEINELCELDYSSYTKEQLADLYTSLNTLYDSYLVLGDTTKQMIIDTYGFEPSKVEAKLADIDDKWQIKWVEEYKATADLHYNEYITWDIDDVDEGRVSSGDITTAIADLGTDISNLTTNISKEGDSISVHVKTVCGETYVTTLSALKANLEELGVAAGYNEDFLAEYAKFDAQIEDVTTTNYDELYNSLKNYDSWYTGLKALIAEMETELGKENAEKLFDDLNTKMVNHMNAAYAELNTRTEVQINLAYELYEVHKAAYGATVHYVSLESYNTLKDSIGLIDTTSYNFLNNSGNFTVPAETVKKYNELQAILVKYNDFVATKGFGSYGTLEEPDVVREADAENEIVRDKDYTVTDDMVEDVIDTLEAALANEEIKKVLGSLINKETGESFDIAGLLTSLIEENVYSDALINTIIQFIYPAVANIFTEVWMGIDPVIDDPAMDVMGQKVDVHADLYLKTVEEATKGLDLPIFPTTLAETISSKYSQFSDVATLLSKATTPSTISKDSDGNWDESTRKSPWNDAVLFKDKLDKDGKVVTDDEGNVTKVLALDWGIDKLTGAAKRERFLQAAQAALIGLEPILLALLCNTPMEKKNNSIGTGYGKDGLNNFYVGDVLFWDDVTLSGIELDIHTIDLVLNATANDGYNNVIAPLFELLGVAAPDGKTFKSTRDVVEKGLLIPLDAVIAKLRANPIETILDILPNLAYAIEADLLLPKLDYLSTTIDYSAGATINADLNDCTSNVGVISTLLPYLDGVVENMTGLTCEGGIIKDVRVDDVVADTLPVEISTFLDIGELLGGADLSSMAGIWEFVAGLVPALEGTQAPDAARIALLGTLTEIDTVRSIKGYNWGEAGKAAHIKANRADVLVYLLRYVLTSGLLGGIVAEPDEMIADIFTNLANNSDETIAAIVELLDHPVEYNKFREFTWFDGIINGESVVGNSANEIYLNPGNDWTEEKAEYLYNNIDDIVAAVLTLAKVDFDKETEEIENDIGALIGGLFSDETMTAIAKLLGNLGDINALIAGTGEEEAEGETDANEPETVAEGEEETEAAAPALDVESLLKGLLGLDFSSYKAYANLAEDAVVDFGIENTDEFVDELTALLAPLKSVLDFILAGENLEITLSESEKITLIGYDGYTNAIVPLLEALGCEVEAMGADDDALTLILEALAGKIESIKDEPVKGIIDMLPGVFYFIASKGLSVSVRNLLQPVYVILDTIRPIYDLDLNELINGLLPEAWHLSINIDDIGLDFVFDLLGVFVPTLDLAGLKDVIYDIIYSANTTYTSVSALANTVDAEGEKVAKKGAYNDNFTQADLLTVVLSFLLEWATVPENGEALDEMLGTDGIVENIGKVFEDVEISYGTPEWYYWFNDDAEAFEAYLATGEGLPNTLDSLEYPNDWDETKAQYLADNLAVLVDAVIGMIEIDGKKYESVAKLLNSLVYGDMNITVQEADEEKGTKEVVINYLFSDETINALIGMLKEVLANVDDVLLEAGYILDVDLVGLKNYTCDKEIETIGAFVEELGYVLDTYAKGLVDLLFFGDDIRIAKKSEKDENGEPLDTIVINGGLGYEKGLALILEALGCDVPDVKDATAYNVLKALGDRVEAILAAPVNEVLDLLPNLIYFLNANGLGVAVDNLLQPVYVLVDKINALGVLEENIAIEDLIKITVEDENGAEKEIKLNLAALSLEYIINVAEEATGLDLTLAETILVDLCIGKIEKAKYTYKMTADRKDTVTVLLTTVLNLLADEAFANKLSEMLGMDVIAAIRTVFESVEIEYTAPEWNYALADNGTVDTMKYAIAYPNNWNENVAKYVTDALPEIGDMVAGMIDGNYATLSALLKDKVNVFTSETLNSLVGAITSLLEGIDDKLLEAAGVLLNVDIVGLKAYEAPEITTVEEFALELANVLNTYATGVVEWLLLGNDYILFVEEDRDIDSLPADLIVINGAHGYAEGLALLLEALGCQNLPEVYDAEGDVIKDLKTEDVVTGVLKSLAARINEIFEMPVERVLDLLPNLLYFLNTNGVAAVIDNTTAALTALITKLDAFGVKLDINELVNLPELMGIADKYEEGDDVISLDNLTIASLLKAVSLMVEGLDLTRVEDVLVGFALGKIEEYDSVSSQAGTTKRMVYADEFDKYDMVTVLVTLVVVTLVDENNADFVKGLAGEEIYQVIMNLCEEDEVTVQEFTWMFTSEETGGDKVGESFTAIETSDLFEEYMYGPLYTEVEAQYIADNFGEFIDNILYLLGLEIAGVSADSLTELINGLLNGSLYNSGNVIAIRDALAGVLDGIINLEVNGAVVGGHIAAVLKEAGIADIAAVAEVKVPEFSNDRVQFVDYLCDVLEPLYGVLRWLLANEDIAFFVQDSQTDAFKLKGAEGYSDGIIPLLEVLECKDILSTEEYYAAIEADGDVLVTSILNPLLDRIDVIIADPANEILAMLPNLFYFINSNGIDTVVKNTANAVFMLLAKIEPIAKIDLYELIGIDLSMINMNWLFEKAVTAIYDATGYKFETLEAADAIAELTVGTLTEYTSANGKTAYKMVYTPEGSISGGPAELVTVVLRLLVKFIMHENNQEMLIGLLKDKFSMDEDAEKYTRGVLKVFAECAVDTAAGMDIALSTLYYLFYGVDEAVGGVAGGVKDINKLWREAIENLREENPMLADMLEEVLGWEEFEDVLDVEEGLAPNGFIAFFLKIKAWFQKIAEWFRNLFNRDESVETVALN